MNNQAAFDEWFELCQQVSLVLPSNQYLIWQFIVGVDGTDEERLEKGKRAFERMEPETIEFVLGKWSEEQDDVFMPETQD